MFGVRALALLAALSVFAAACAGGTTMKAGGDEPPITLRMGTDDSPGKPAADQVEEFARQAARLSDGRIIIEPAWHAAGDGPDWDQRVARMVVAGQLDVGLLPARAFDTEGVTTLRALNAPFLVTSDELVEQITTGELAEPLMAGLDVAGLVGLALLPEGLRHPFGLQRPLLGPSDYVDQTIRAPTSETTRALFAALGADVDQEHFNVSTHVGADSSYVLAPPGIATGNVTFYPKINVVVVNAEVFAHLTEGQRELLAEAAVATRDWAIAEIPSDTEAAQAFCEAGRVIALASATELAALESAAEPVYAELERDAETNRLISAIRTMKAELPPPPAIEACGTPPARPTLTPSEGQSAIDGIYRMELTPDVMRETGMTNKQDIINNTGVFTWTFDKASVCYDQAAPAPITDPPFACWKFSIEGDNLLIDYLDGYVETFSWQLSDGVLRLSVVQADPEWLPLARAWGAVPWIRVGDHDDQP